MSVSIPINYIGEEAKVVRGRSLTNNSSLLAYRLLAEKISDLVEKEAINIRVVQPGDNLESIAVGLSQDRLKKNAKVEYLGDSERIQQQKNENPSKQLSTAYLIFEKQFVYLKNLETILLADKVEDLNLTLGE